VSIPPTVELSVTERLSGARIHASLDRIRGAARESTVVKLTPDSALAIADLIELLARHAGIELPEPVKP
jgi:hypothetical protein